MLPTPATLKTAFTELASEEQIERTVLSLEANGIHTLIAENADQARRLFFDLVPDGAQVHQGASATLETLGITAEIETSGRLQALRPKLRSLDRQTQGTEIRRLGASPDYMVGSVNAVTEDGHVVIASAGGSQLGSYAYGAGKLIWVVGTQKIVATLAEAFRRIEEYVLPLEDERLLKVLKMHTSLNKLLIINKERPGRITMILVKENLGF